VSSPPSAPLAERVAALRWYHTLELAPGLLTPGYFDLRGAAAALPWPDLTGLRCLDVGTFDGFWAFEMERRGAEEVVAVDVLDPAAWDWPAGSEEATRSAIAELKGAGSGFELAAEALGSGVRRTEMSVHELSPDTLGGFDFVYLGSLLLHLSDPIGALRAVHSVCEGELMVLDAVDAALSWRHPRRPLAELDMVGRPWWWRPNRAALGRMVSAAGFDVTHGPAPVRLARGRGAGRLPRRPRELASREGRRLIWTALRGDPHAYVRARPSRARPIRRPSGPAGRGS
jgi:tRNA (mo5U34)-methyltransferase